MKVRVIDIDHFGNGIAKIDNKVIFVPKTITDDICDIEIYETHKNYSKAKLINMIEKSSLHKEALCPYYNECGGCNISNLEYNEQLKFKENKVKNIFKKYLKLDIIPKVVPSPIKYNYRNKITYHYDNTLGLISEYDGIVDIDKCLLVSNNVNRLYNEIKKEDLSQVKLITIRECNNGLILIITGRMDTSKLKDKCLSIYLNNKCIYKKDDGYIFIKDIKYIVSPNSFFQVNTNNISNLYDEIVRYGCFSKDDVVVDLYSGVGSISLYIAKYVKKVLGIEIVDDAVKDARENAKINNINNAKFISGDVSKLINDNIQCDTLIVDPPRTGLDKHTIDVICKKEIKKIIYVSCNPMTLVRDIKLFTKYKLNDISIIDMFPQTNHIECVCLLTLKN